MDLAKHAAKAYHLNQGFDEVVVLRRIRAVFEAEWGTPTDEPKGQLLDGKKPE